MPRLPLAPLLLLATLLPTAAAQEGDPLCIIFVEPGVDFRTVRIHADLIVPPEERDNLSRRIDADGDRVLTAAEVAAYEASTRETLGNDTAAYGERALFLDGRGPARAEFRRQLTNWTGPIEQARMGAVTEIREYAMTPDRDFAHALSGGPNASPARVPFPVVAIETVVFAAPDGWVVHDVTGNLGYTGNGTMPSPSPTTTRYAEKTVRISGFDTRSSWTVVFSEEGKDPYAPRTSGGGGMPGPSAAGVAAALVVAALAWRARKGRGA